MQIFLIILNQLKNRLSGIGNITLSDNEILMYKAQWLIYPLTNGGFDLRDTHIPSNLSVFDPEFIDKLYKHMLQVIYELDSCLYPCKRWVHVR